MKTPALTIGLRLRQRVDGTSYMIGKLPEDLHLAAGTELHVRRIATDSTDGPTFALQIIPPIERCAQRAEPAVKDAAMNDREIRVRTWIKAGEPDVQGGLLGWISVEYGSLLIDNITLRRTSGGRFALSFPSRTAKNGQRHAIVRPVGDEARRAIEAEIFAQLGQREDLGAAAEDRP